MGVLNNLNYIHKIQYVPCWEPGPLILIETGLAAGALALLEFFSFGCRDILKAKLGKSPICGRQFKAAVVGGVPPELVRRADKLLGFVLPIDRALYAWLIADVASGFIANWESFAYASAGCIPNQFSTSHKYTMAPFGLDTGQEAIIPYILRDEPIPGQCAGWLIPSDWYFDATFDCQCRPLFGDGTASFDLYLHAHAATDWDFHKSNTPPGFPGQTRRGISHTSTQAPHTPVVTQYTARIFANQPMICFSGQATSTCSPLPILDQFLSPLSCFNQDLHSYFPWLPEV